MNEDAVRDYCCLRLPRDSPQYAELHEEFIRDPANSRVGRFCQETERVVRCVSDGELDWEGILNAWVAEESTEVEEIEESVSEYGTGTSDSAREVGTGILDNVADSTAHSNRTATSGIEADRATTSRQRWNARPSKVTIGVATASLLLLSIGFNAWLVWSKSVEQKRLGIALDTLASDLHDPVGSKEIQEALAYIEQSLGRSHPAYKNGQSRLHFSLSFDEDNYKAATTVALEIAQNSEGKRKAEWLLNAARDARLAGDDEQSKEILAEAAKSSSSVYSAWAWESLSRIEHAAGHLNEAIVYAKKSVECAGADVRQSQFLEGLATRYTESQDWKNAELAISNAIDLNERNGTGSGPYSYDLLALVAHELNEPVRERTARKQLVASLENGGFPHDKRFAVSIMLLAEVEFRTGDIDAADANCYRAVQEFKRIGETNGVEYAEALVLASRLANHFGDYRFASKMANGALTIVAQLDDDSLKSWLLSESYGELAEAQRNLGDFASAENAAQAGLKAANQFGDARLVAARWLNLSAVSVSAAKFEEAQERIAKAEESSVDFSVLTRQSLRASVLIGNGNPQEAAEILESALATATNVDDKALLEFQLAKSLESIPGRESEAVEILARNQQALEIRFHGRVVDSNGIATGLRTAEPLLLDERRNLLGFPDNLENNPYFG